MPADGIAIGVLALQGNVVEHVRALEDVGANAIPVKTRADLDTVAGLVIPGGESTTVMKLLARFGLAEPIVARVRAGMPLWGTCMGLIVAAHDVAGMPEQPTLDLLDVSVRRNAFGRQVNSSEVQLAIPVLGEQPFPAVFIRAPWIERAGPAVQTLAWLDGHGVLVRQGHILGSSFHPEMSQDRRVHQYFLSMVASFAIGKQTTAA
ncbi:MAG: pyridoxal 5'-phosphate synthase glutaminase subunit PdxT [Candidatus Eremiobacteraeota bacterium]|nr:pyridoxal 5'-phosphate synthase glutaminase subunit PdxT [Candidatus Eremiobacteraeota bacterium]